MSEKATFKKVLESLKTYENPEIAAHSQRFFKTGKGEYGEGDRFLGIRVPVLRDHSRRFQSLSLKETLRLLQSPYHEARLVAVFVLVLKFQKGTEAEKEEIYLSYLSNTPYLNGWDIVDASSHKIVGPWLENRPRGILLELARSASLWERRIAIISTFHFIRLGETETTLTVSELLLRDPEDLIHKAVGWMLRELGKRDLTAEEAFLQKHLPHLPRTLLRYAIEKFPKAKRDRYLDGSILKC